MGTPTTPTTPTTPNTPLYDEVHRSWSDDDQKEHSETIGKLQTIVKARVNSRTPTPTKHSRESSGEVTYYVSKTHAILAKHSKLAELGKKYPEFEKLMNDPAFLEDMIKTLGLKEDAVHRKATADDYASISGRPLSPPRSATPVKGLPPKHK